MEKEKSTNRKRFWLELLVACAIASWVIVMTIDEYSSINEIRLNKGESIGVIVDYKIIGTDNHYIQYEYYVEGERYAKNVSAKKIFKGCYKKRDCIGRKFIVYYSKKNPEKSEIDLDREIVQNKY